MSGNTAKCGGWRPLYDEIRVKNALKNVKARRCVSNKVPRLKLRSKLLNTR